MNRRAVLILGAIMGVAIVGAVGWYLASPLFINRAVQEEFPLSIPGPDELSQMPEDERQQVAEEVMATAAAMPGKTMEEPMTGTDQATVLAQASFRDADSFHKGSGTATIYQLPDGARILRFENFAVTNGPDLHVLLAAGAAPANRDQLGEYIDLGALKGNLGDQNYDVPADLDLAAYQSVVIYCVPFHVVFATATFGG
jgi:hypothetical protein